MPDDAQIDFFNEIQSRYSRSSLSPLPGKFNTNSLFKVDSFDEGSFVVKCFKQEKEAQSEFRAISEIYHHDLMIAPVPKGFRSLKNGHGYLVEMSWLEGKLLSNYENAFSLPKMSNVAKAISKLHSVDMSQYHWGKLASEGPHFLSWKSFVEQRIKNKIDKLIEVGVPLKAELYRSSNFLQILHQEPKKSLVHSDLHSENIIIQPSGKAHLIDFERSFVGDYLYDLPKLLWFGCQTSERLCIIMEKAYDIDFNESIAERFDLYARMNAIDMVKYLASNPLDKIVDSSLFEFLMSIINRPWQKRNLSSFEYIGK